MSNGLIKCKKCGEERWSSQFREYAPGKHRRTCRTCENEKQADYQRAYALRKRERAAASAAVAKDDPIATLAKQVAALTASLSEVRAKLQMEEAISLDDLLS